MIALEVVVLMGMASGYLVAMSMHVSMNLYPPTAVRKGPSKWNGCHLSHLHVVPSRCCLVHPLTFITFPYVG